MKLQETAINALRGKRGALVRLSKKLGVTRMTVYNWIRDNDERLISKKVIRFIEKETGLNKDQIIEST